MIRARGNRYVVELYDPAEGRKVTVSARQYGMTTPRTKTEAKELERRAMDTLGLGRGPLTVEEYAQEYCERAFNEKGRPIKSQTNNLNRGKLKPFVDEFGSRSMASITRLEARRFIQRCPHGAHLAITMFKAAKRDDVVVNDPFDGLKAPPAPKQDLYIFTMDEYMNIIRPGAIEAHGDYGREVMVPFMDFMYGCGARPGEAAGAERKHLNLDAKIYNITRQWLIGYRRWDTPKWESAGEVHLLQFAVDSLRELDTGEILFPAKRGGMQYKGSLYQYFRDLREVTGIPVVPKAFRHAHASYLLNELGLAPYTVAQQMRHRDGGKLVATTYGHPDRELHLGRIAEAELLTGAREGVKSEELPVF